MARSTALPRFVLRTPAILVLFFLTLPTIVIVPMSFSSKTFLSFPPPGLSLRWYETLFASDDFRNALLYSIEIGVPAALFSTILGTLAALGVVRGSFPGRDIISSLMIAPLVLPVIVLAISLYPIMVQLGLAGSTIGVLIGHTVVCTPLVFVTVSASLRSYSPNLELAAMTMGADWWRTMRHITLPMIQPGLFGGFVFAFSYSFDEIVLALFLTRSNSPTLPRYLWDMLNFQLTPTVAAASVLVMVSTVSLLVLVAATRPKTGAR